MYKIKYRCINKIKKYWFLINSTDKNNKINYKLRYGHYVYYWGRSILRFIDSKYFNFTRMIQWTMLNKHQTL